MNNEIITAAKSKVTTERIESLMQHIRINGRMATDSQLTISTLVKQHTMDARIIQALFKNNFISKINGKEYGYNGTPVTPEIIIAVHTTYLAMSANQALAVVVEDDTDGIDKALVLLRIANDRLQELDKRLTRIETKMHANFHGVQVPLALDVQS